MVIGKSNPVFVTVLIVTGVFILLWLLVYYTTSDSVKDSLNDKLARKEKMQIRLVNSAMPLPEPIPFSQKSYVQKEKERSTKEKSTRICICLFESTRR